MTMGPDFLAGGCVVDGHGRAWRGTVEDVSGPVAASGGVASCFWRRIRGRVC